MYIKNPIPRQKRTVPENIVIPPVPSLSHTVISGSSLSPVSNQQQQTTPPRAKIPNWQSSRSAGLLPEPGVGNKYLSSPAYWVGKGGLQSPRLHGFSPREFSDFEQRKSAVESVPEEDEREVAEDKAEGQEEEEDFVFNIGKKDQKEGEGVFGGTLTESSAVEGRRGREGRKLTSANWTLSLISGVGILPDEVHSSSGQLPSPGPESDTNQSYRSLNWSRLSATGETTLQSALNSPVATTPHSTASTGLTKKLPPLPRSPISPQQRLSPLLPPPNLEYRSRLVSITPSLAAGLDMEDSKNTSINVKPAEASLRGVQNKFKKSSGKRVENVPILSSFSTDNSSDSSAEEEEEVASAKAGAETVNEKHQADYLPLNVVLGQLNLVQIERGNSITGRKQSVKRKPVHGRSRLVEEWKMKSRSNSAPNVESNVIASPITEDSPEMLDLKKPSYQRHSYLPPTQQSPGIYSKRPLSRTIQYEGYALRLPTGVYVPLNTDTPLGVDQRLLFKVVPKRELDDGIGTAYHIILPNESTTSDASLRGDALYVFDEASRGFLPEQIPELENERLGNDKLSIASMKGFQWPLRDDVVISQERLKHFKPQSKYSGKRPEAQVGYTTDCWSENFHEQTFQDEHVDSHPGINKNQTRVLGLGWGTRGVGNIDHIKSLEGVVSDVPNGDWNQQYIEEDLAHGNRKLSEGSRIGKHGIYVTRDFEIESMHSPPEKEEIDSETDAETRERKSDMNMEGQSWLEMFGSCTAATSTNKDSPGWRESQDAHTANIVSVGSEEDPVSPVGQVQAAVADGVNAFQKTPRLPIYNPPQDRDDTFIQTPLLTTLSLPKLSSVPLQDYSISQPPPIMEQPTPLLSPPKPRKRYVTVTLNLYRSWNELPRTTRVLIPVSSTVKQFDDQKVFGRIKREYKSMIGGEWRTWFGLRGIKWVWINEHPKTSKRLRSLSASNYYSHRVHSRPGSISNPYNNTNNYHYNNNNNNNNNNSNNNNNHNTNTTTPLDPNLTKSTQLIKFISKPHTACNQHGYINLLRNGMNGPRLATYSIEIMEDWVPWKVGIAGIVPILGSVAVTIVWYYFGPSVINAGSGREMSLGAFQIGILVAVLGWGVVGLMVLLS